MDALIVMQDLIRDSRPKRLLTLLLTMSNGNCKTCKKLACVQCVFLEHKEGHSYLSTEDVSGGKETC